MVLLLVGELNNLMKHAGMSGMSCKNRQGDTLGEQDGVGALDHLI